MIHKTTKAAVHPSTIGAVITLAFAMSLAQADHHLPSDCETARDRAKSKYGAVRYQFDRFNRCLSRAGDDVAQCRTELNDQQTALGDYIFAERVAQDICGAKGESGDVK